MRFLLPLLALISLAVGAAVLPRDEPGVEANYSNVTSVSEDGIQTLDNKPGMARFFEKDQWRGANAWCIDWSELRTHWKDIAVCYNILPKFSYSVLLVHAESNKHWGCMVFERGNCGGASYWFQESQPQLWTTHWQGRIRSVKCYLDI